MVKTCERWACEREVDLTWMSNRFVHHLFYMQMLCKVGVISDDLRLSHAECIVYTIIILTAHYYILHISAC